MSPRAPYEVRARAGASNRVAASWHKRAAIRYCRALTLALGPGASGEVRRDGVGLLYQCHAVRTPTGRTALRVDEL